jgi:phosphoribosylamine--glycine ligase
MNILLIGCGGREHAIGKKLISNRRLNMKLYYYGKHSNVGLDRIGKRLEGDIISLVQQVQQCKITLIVVGPEKYLEEGLVDKFTALNIKCIGPTKKLARIETSKSYAREFMTRNGLSIMCPKYRVIEPNDHNYARYLVEFNKYVIKRDGLHGGKGVKVSNDHLTTLNEAIELCEEIIRSGEKFIIEEKLEGNEFSLMSFSDGYTLKHMPPIKDYKRAFNNDKGPNTGSMGSIKGDENLLSFLNKNDISICQVINETINNCFIDYLTY